MSSRTLTAGFAAKAALPHVNTCLLIEMRLASGTLYLTDAPHAVEYNGLSWLSAFGIGKISEIKETASEAAGLSFSLTTNNAAMLSAALNESMQGRLVILRLALFTASGLTVSVDVDDNVWQGFLDVASVVKDESGNSVINVTAEHMLARWDKPNLVRFSHEDQQRFYPGDMFFQYTAKLVEATVVWPSKSFFQK